MPAVYPDRLTTRAVPQPRAGVRRSGDQIRGIDAENAIPANKPRRQPRIAHTVTIIKLNLPHPPLVPFERPLQLEPVEVPQLHRLIGTRRGQQSAIRGEQALQHVRVVRLELVKRLEVRRRFRSSLKFPVHKTRRQYLIAHTSVKKNSPHVTRPARIGGDDE